MPNCWVNGDVGVNLAVPMPGTATLARHGLTSAQSVGAAREGATVSAGPIMGQEVLVHSNLQIQLTIVVSTLILWSLWYVSLLTA